MLQLGSIMILEYRHEGWNFLAEIVEVKDDMFRYSVFGSWKNTTGEYDYTMETGSYWETLPDIKVSYNIIILKT